MNSPAPLSDQPLHELPGGVRLRRFPYPFRAMLAISSDIDRTSMPRFRNIHRFLNTHEETPMGVGLGLDVADSLWIFLDGQRATDISLLAGYERGNPQPYADELTAYAHAGWIDTLHTYGNYSAGAAIPAFERPHAEEAIAELRERGLELRVWVNHGSAANTQNFGRGGYQVGDLPGSPAYHTDLLLDYGIRFASNHRGGDILGTPFPLSPMSLRDGRRLWGFSRYNAMSGPGATRAIESHADFFAKRPNLLRANPEGNPATMLWWPPLLDAQLARERLDELVASSAYCVAAQHLGDLGDSDLFDPAAVETLTRLRDYQDDGLILVTRVSRLLEHARVGRHVRAEVRGTAGQLYIDIAAVADPVFGTFAPSLEQVRGLTFYVEAPATTHLLLGGVPVPNSELTRSPTDGTSPSIGVKWFAPDTADYVALHAVDLGPAPGAGSTPATEEEPEPVDLPAAIELLRESRDQPPSTVEPKIFAAAVDRSVAMYSRPTDYYESVLERIGFTHQDRALDLGSGPGQWGVALARTNREVVGIDARPEYVEVARRMARWLGHRGTTFLAGRAESTVLEPGFDLVWCHSVLMFTSHEAVLRNTASWLRADGRFYCAYTTEGARLRQVMRGLASRDEALVEQGLGTLLANERWRAGLGQGSRMLALRQDELLTMCTQLGLVPEEEPRVQDMQVSFLGFPCTFDVICRRRGAETASVEELLERGLPAAALDAADDTTSPELRLRAQIASGAESDGGALLAGLPESAQALLLGMARDAGDRHEQALWAYSQAPQDEQVVALTVMCLLELGRAREAFELSDKLPRTADMRTLTLRTAAALRSEGMDEARAEAKSWVGRLAEGGQAEAAEVETLGESLSA